MAFAVLSCYFYNTPPRLSVVYVHICVCVCVCVCVCACVHV